MEKRLLLAIVLCVAILILWQVVFMPKQPIPESTPVSPAEVEKRPGSSIIKRESPQTTKAPPKQEISEPEKPPQATGEVSKQEIIIDTSLYQAVWSNKGAVLQSWKLKKHKDEDKNDLELISPRSSELSIYPFSIWIEDTSYNDKMNSALYKVSNSKLELRDGQKGEIRFEYADENGNSIEKIFTFYDGRYNFDINMNVRKDGKIIENPQLLWGPGFSKPSPVQQNQRFGGTTGFVTFVSGKIERNDESKYDPAKSIINYSLWAAYEDQYFAALFLLLPTKNNAEFIKEDIENVSNYFLLVKSPQNAYIGPKDIDFLTAFGNETKKIIKFGLVGFIAEILLRAIKFIYKIFPNWGIAIILITFITKLIFFPLTYKSTQSMAKMQELQPKVKALRAKYKKAKQDIDQRRRMNEEMMKMYKQHGVNPAGGCLPLIIQMPVFFGFFQILRVAIEFRHSPFIFWIADLSTKDPYYITPILMGITQYISQKLTPTSADPTQQKMMLIMPVFFTFIFLSFPSGLVLYWLTQNILQIAQQYIINNINKKKKREIHGKRKKR